MKRILTLIISLLTLSAYSQNDTIILNDIVLEGIRVSKKAPFSEKTITSEEISKTLVGAEPSNIISKTNSVTMSSDNGSPFGYTYFRIRGIDQSRINMTLNGIPLNESEDQGVFFSNMPSFMETIESIQIQRGVGTSTNGTASVGASINLRTFDYEKEGASIKYDFGSFNTHKITTKYNTGLLPNNFTFGVTGSNYNTDGYRYGSGGQGSMIYLNSGYFTEKSSLKISGIFGTSINGMAWQPVSEDDIAIDPRTNYNKENAKDSFNQSLILLEYKNNINKNILLTSSLFYNALSGSYDYLRNGEKNLSLNSEFYGNVNNLSVRLDNVTINYGISFNKYRRDHNYTFNTNNSGYKNDYSTYLKLNLNLNRFNIFYDTQVRHTTFRYDVNRIENMIDLYNLDMENKKWTFINPKGGITYNFNKSTLFYSIGYSNREPTRTTLFNGGDFLIDNTNINTKPESVLDHEMGYKFFSKNFNFKGNLFYMDYTNELLSNGSNSPTGVGGVTQYDKTYKKGIEADIDFNLFIFKVTNNQTLMTSKILETNKEAVLTPNYISNTTIGVDLTRNISINLLNKIQSKSYLDNDNEYTIPSFTTFDLNAIYNKNKWMTMITIGNITNQKYYTNGNMIDKNFNISDRRHLFVNAPINIFATIKYNL